MHEIPSPCKAQCAGDFHLTLFRVEALVAVPLHAEKMNMLPGIGAFLGTGRSGRIEALSNLVPHLEQLHMLALWGRLGFRFWKGFGLPIHLGTKLSPTISLVK